MHPRRVRRDGLSGAGRQQPRRAHGPGPSGSVFYTGEGVPAWRNRLLVGCLGSHRLEVFTFTPPDGAVYAIMSNRDGRAKDPFPRQHDDVRVRLTPNAG